MTTEQELRAAVMEKIKSMLDPSTQQGTVDGIVAMLDEVNSECRAIREIVDQKIRDLYDRHMGVLALTPEQVSKMSAKELHAHHDATMHIVPDVIITSVMAAVVSTFIPIPKCDQRLDPETMLPQLLYAMQYAAKLVDNTPPITVSTVGHA